MKGGRIVSTKGRKEVTKPIPVAARNIFTGEVLYFKSCGEAARELNLCESSIRSCKDGKRIRAGMYTFRRMNDNERSEFQE